MRVDPAHSRAYLVRLVNRLPLLLSAGLWVATAAHGASSQSPKEPRAPSDHATPLLETVVRPSPVNEDAAGLRKARQIEAGILEQWRVLCRNLTGAGGLPVRDLAPETTRPGVGLQGTSPLLLRFGATDETINLAPGETIQVPLMLFGLAPNPLAALVWAHPGANQTFPSSEFTVRVTPQDPANQRLALAETPAGPHLTRWETPPQLSMDGVPIVQYEITASDLLELGGTYYLDLYAVAFDTASSPVPIFALASATILVVPEPSVSLLLLGGGLALWGWRRR